MPRSLILVTVILALPFAACVATTAPPDAAQRGDGGMLWVQHAAEYRAVSEQAYAEASRDLLRFMMDGDWSALPGIDGDAEKPPAIILDIDETVVSNYDFQINHLPYTSLKHYLWNRDNKAVPVPGAVRFVAEAQRPVSRSFLLPTGPASLLTVSRGTVRRRPFLCRTF